MDPPIETVSVRLRTRSLSRAGSSPLAPSKRGSATGVIFSPAAPGIDDDFIFDGELVFPALSTTRSVIQWDVAMDSGKRRTCRRDAARDAEVRH